MLLSDSGRVPARPELGDDGRDPRVGERGREVRWQAGPVEKKWAGAWRCFGPWKEKKTGGGERELGRLG